MQPSKTSGHTIVNETFNFTFIMLASIEKMDKHKKVWMD